MSDLGVRGEREAMELVKQATALIQQAKTKIMEAAGVTALRQKTLTAWSIALDDTQIDYAPKFNDWVEEIGHARIGDW